MTTGLKSEYDRLRAMRDALALEMKLDADGTARATRVEMIAAAARSGEPFPDLSFNRPARQLELDGLELALKQVTDDLVAQLGADREHGIAHLPLPVGEVDAKRLCTAIDQAFDAAARQASVTAARLEIRQRYDVALARFHELRGEQLAEGIEPPVASERAKQAMGSQAADLFPPGSPGDLSFSGRPRGDSLTATGSTTVGIY